MRDFIEDHKTIVLIVAIVIVLIGVVFGVRSCNAKKKANQPTEESVVVTEEPTLEQDTTAAPKPTSAYQAQLGINASKANERVEVTTEAPTEPPVETEPPKSTFDIAVTVFDKTEVPVKNVDGSSCKAYLNSVKLADFGTYWGTALTEDDFNSQTRHLVGVDQNPDDITRGDLQSVGWLINNFNSLGANDCVKFTNLHVIGSLSDSHVALLCSYDWYSAFGLKDTLVLFEDQSGTLDKSSFPDGSIFSASVFVHNMKVMQVKNQNVVCVEYNVFAE